MPRPLVRITWDAYRVLNVEGQRSRDGLETGGILLGMKYDEDALLVTVAGTPGPHALRSHARFERDLEHAKMLEENAHRRDGSIWIGEWHTHPRGPRKPSSLDLATYDGLLRDPHLTFEEVVCLIVTRDWYFGWGAPRCWAWIVAPGTITRARAAVTDGDRMKVVS
jgi:integrative and conjugative element protein (TIGR02256 family)